MTVPQMAQQIWKEKQGLKRGAKPKLTPEQARDIREMYANKSDPIGWSVPQIARTFGVSAATVNKALNGGYDNVR